MVRGTRPHPPFRMVPKSRGLPQRGTTAPTARTTTMLPDGTPRYECGRFDGTPRAAVRLACLARARPNGFRIISVATFRGQFYSDDANRLRGETCGACSDPRREFARSSRKIAPRDRPPKSTPRRVAPAPTGRRSPAEIHLPRIVNFRAPTAVLPPHPGVGPPDPGRGSPEVRSPPVSGSKSRPPRASSRIFACRGESGIPPECPSSFRGGHLTPRRVSP